MAFTLNELLKIEKSPLRAGVIVGLLIDAVAMQDLPIDTAGQLRISISRWKTLPSVGWRKINAAFSEASGTTEQLIESVFILGGSIDVDIALARVKNVLENPRALQARMKLQAIAYEFNDIFVNGDWATNVDTFEGLKKRVAGLAARQTVKVGGADAAFGTFVSDGNMHRFLDDLDLGIYHVEGHGSMASAMYTGEDAFLALRSILRRQKLLDTTRDQFDRVVESYKGIPIRDIGVKADQSTKIITATEDAGDAGNNTSSIYIVRYGDQILMGFEEYPLRTDDLGLIDNGVTMRTIVEWPVGLALWNNRAIVRVKNFKTA